MPVILIVDDVMENVRLLKNLLQDFGQIVFARNGLEALVQAQRHHPDIVLLDVMMPGLDGYETCRRLKADPQTQDIPVIFITGADGENDEAKGLAVGAIDYITKPFAPAIVRARVQNHLALVRANTELRKANDALREMEQELRLPANNTMPEIFRLPVHFIERIEVVRGPVSALYGADALTGVVNIITGKQPNEAGIRAGNAGQREAWIGRNGAAGPVEWAAAFSYSHNTDEMVTRSLPLRTSFAQTFRHDYADVDLKLRSGPFSAGFWALNYGKLENGNPANPRGETAIETQHRHIDLAYSTDLAPTTQFKAALVHTRFVGFGLGELRQGRSMDFHNGERRTSADLALTETRFSAHRLRFNLGAVREQRFQLMPSPPTAPSSDPRTNNYLSIQDEYAFAPDWELTAGLRADRYSDIGTVRNPRFGLVWNINPKLTTKLLQGEAFRAPAYGNPGTPILVPERMRNTELAFDYRPNERWHMLWSMYRYRASALRDGPASVARDGKGSELELNWLATPQLRVNTSLAYVAVTDSQTGMRVPLSPRKSAKIALNWRAAERWSSNLRWEGYWDRARAPTDRRAPLDDFQVVHLTLRHDLNRQASVQFGAHNLLNSRSYIPIIGESGGADFQLPERSLSLQLEYRF